MAIRFSKVAFLEIISTMLLLINKNLHFVEKRGKSISIFDSTYHLEYSDPLAGDLFMETTNVPEYTLEDAFSSLFSDLELNYQM